MISDPISINPGGPHRISVAWGKLSADEYVEVWWRANSGHDWALQHRFTEPGELELSLQQGESIIVCNPPELLRRVAATLTPVKPPAPAPTIEERMAALERGTVARAAEPETFTATVQ